MGDQVRWRRQVITSSTLSGMWRSSRDEDSVQGTIQEDSIPLAVPLGSSFSFNLSWADNEKNIPDQEWSNCKVRILKANPRSFFPAGHFTDNGQRKYVWHISQPLPQLHPGSWDPTHSSSLLLLPKSGDKCRVIRPVEAARLLGSQTRRGDDQSARRSCHSP